MSDKQLMVLSTLEDIQFSIKLISQRFEVIENSDDFLADENGLVR
ncbi:MAG: hypothetical protein Q9M36_08460 [Sulfurovum sp.]|nr:hypothetical protein [Sulfurovum sp.]